MNIFHASRVKNWTPDLLGPWIVVADDCRIVWSGPSMETAKRVVKQQTAAFINLIPAIDFMSLGVRS